MLEAAKDADHLILGRRGTGGFNRLTLGSVSSQVAHHAELPGDDRPGLTRPRVTGPGDP